MIDADQYERTLVRLFRNGSPTTWPLRPDDQSVLLRALSSHFARGVGYSETDVTGRLETAIGRLGLRAVTDRVSARRLLVDAGFLERDAAGRSYRLGVERLAAAFGEDCTDVDPTRIISDLRAARARRKEAHT